jgi:hypothetical protein
MTTNIDNEKEKQQLKKEIFNEIKEYIDNKFFGEIENEIEEYIDKTFFNMEQKLKIVAEQNKEIIEKQKMIEEILRKKGLLK